MQHADHLAAGDQRHAHQGADPLGPQDRVQHRAVVDVVEDHRLVSGGDPPGKAPAHRDPHALAYLLLQPCGRRGDQFSGREVQQQDRGGVGPQDGPGALQQLGEQVMVVKAGQGGIGDRLDVAEPVLQLSAADKRCHFEASPLESLCVEVWRLDPGWKGPFQRRVSALIPVAEAAFAP